MLIEYSHFENAHSNDKRCVFVANEAERKKTTIIIDSISLIRK